MRGAVGSLGLVLLAATPVAAAEVQTRTLDNGLQVLVETRPGATEVGVAVAYRVGMRDAPPGYRGLTHLAEHLAFRGTLHLPGLRGYEAIAALGGRTGGTTTLDATVYSHALPPAGLETALWVESDRMGFLVEALRPEDLPLEQRIVARELELRRGPGGAPGFVLERLFPEAHPYFFSPDEAADVQSVSLAGLQGFLQRHYRPDLAAVAVVGDVDPEVAFEAVERWFGPLVVPSGAPPPRDARAPEVPCWSAEASTRGRARTVMMWRARDPGPPGELELLTHFIGAEARRVIQDPGVEVDAELVRFDLESLVTLDVAAKSTSLETTRGPLRRALGELGEGISEHGFEQARGAVRFRVARALEAPGDRAVAWAESAVTSKPSPVDLEAGLEAVTRDAVLRRAEGLRGGRPDLWIELEGLKGRQMPKPLRFSRVPCRRL